MRSRIHSWRGMAALLLALAASACGGDDGGTPDDDQPDAEPPPEHAVLKRASKSGTIAITGNDLYVAMVNPEADSVAVFETTGNARTALVNTGDEPSAVVIHPDDTTFFVANRGSATVVKVTGIETGTPDVGDSVDVGSEPTGLALSPSGATLYVAEWAEGRIAVIDTATMTETGSIDAPLHPRAVAVTNDGDQDDADELIVVPEFYGEAADVEGSDISRHGRVRLYSTADLSPADPIVLAPLDSGFAPAGATDPTTAMTSPNQLWAAVVIGTKVYLPSVSASPAPPINFQTNVQPVVFVGDLDTHAEDLGINGTMNLAALVRDQVPDNQTRFFLADIVDIAFVGDSVMYALSRGADVLQRVALEDDGPHVGSNQNFQIDLNVVPTGSTQKCQTPNGVTIGHDHNIAYINCWATRQLGIVDFAMQALVKTVEAAPISISEADAQAGLHFYFTARARWSKDAWSDCGSCHPDGLSDNVTWIFPAGPRQTTSMDGSFSHGPGAQKQRIFNWTGIFDEVHDFERNTRDVSGGLGAITQANPTCGNPATEARVDPLPGNLAGLTKTLQDCTRDWDKIEAFVKTLRPPRSLQKLDSASVERGRVLFGAGADGAGCVNCHGGAGWTASRRYATTQLAADPFTAPSAWPTAGTFRWNFHTLQVANQPATTVFDDGVGSPDEPENAAIAPGEVACTIRNVGTFGSAALEVKNFAVNGTAGVRAQGRLGYNVPSLYGLALGAPYLHHGGAGSLQALFDDAPWAQHATASNPNWLVGDAATVAQRKADMIAFLLSIDATAAEQALPAAFEGCPAQQ